jgi:hypothetical protein
MRPQFRHQVVQLSAGNPFLLLINTELIPRINPALVAVTNAFRATGKPARLCPLSLAETHETSQKKGLGVFDQIGFSQDF